LSEYFLSPEPARGDHRIEDGRDVKSVMPVQTDGVESGVVNDFEDGRLFKAGAQQLQIEVGERVDHGDANSSRPPGRLSNKENYLLKSFTEITY